MNLCKKSNVLSLYNSFAMRICYSNDNKVTRKSPVMLT